MEKQVYTAEEVAKMLDCRPRTIYEMVKEGKLKCVKVGRLIKFPKQYIEEFLNV